MASLNSTEEIADKGHCYVHYGLRSLFYINSLRLSVENVNNKLKNIAQNQDIFSYLAVGEHRTTV